MVDYRRYVYHVFDIYKRKYHDIPKSEINDLIQTGMVGLFSGMKFTYDDGIEDNNISIIRYSIDKAMKAYYENVKMKNKMINSDVSINFVTYPETKPSKKNKTFERAFSFVSYQDKQFMKEFYMNEYHTAAEINRFISLSNRIINRMERCK